MQESSSTGRPETEHRKRIEVIWLGFHTTAWSWVGVARLYLSQKSFVEPLFDVESLPTCL
jgi:hypothetical protein